MLSRSARNNKIVALIVLTASLFLPAVLHDVITAQGNPVLCPLKAVTGIPCPSCGIGRAFASITHGEFHQAFRFHQLSIPLYVLAFIAWCLVLAELITSKDLFPSFPSLNQRIWYLFTFILIFQIVRTYTFLMEKGVDGIINQSLIIRGFNMLGSFFS